MAMEINSVYGNYTSQKETKQVIVLLLDSIWI